jgi:hypothetical protein
LVPEQQRQLIHHLEETAQIQLFQLSLQQVVEVVVKKVVLLVEREDQVVVLEQELVVIVVEQEIHLQQFHLKEIQVEILLDLQLLKEEVAVVQVLLALMELQTLQEEQVVMV